MKRFVLICCVIVCMIIALTGCSGSKNQDCCKNTATPDCCEQAESEVPDCCAGK